MANDTTLKLPKMSVIDSDPIFDEYVNNADSFDQDGVEEQINPDNTNFLSDATLNDTQDSFGDKTQNVTRNEIMDLFHKVQSSHQSNEKELLGILRDALRSEMHHDDTHAFESYQKVSNIFAPEETSNTEDSFGNDANSSSNSDLPSPSSVEASALGGKKYIYDNLKFSDYEFDADFNGPAKEYEISSNEGIIKINGIGSKDTMFVKNMGEGTREIDVYKNGSKDPANTLVFRITGNPTKILLNTLPQNVAGVDELDSLIQVGGKSNKTLWPSSGDKLKTLVPSGGDGGTQAQTLLQKITDAINDNSNDKWNAALNYIDSMWPSSKGGPANFYDTSQDSYPNGAYKNPDGKAATGRPLAPVVIRKVLTAIYAYAGNNDAKFQILMTKISPEIRTEMINCLDWANTQNESSFGSQFPGAVNPDYTAYQQKYPSYGYGYGPQQTSTDKPAPPPQYLNSPNPKSYAGKTASQDGDKWNNQEAIDILNGLPHMQTDNATDSTDDSSSE